MEASKHEPVGVHGSLEAWARKCFTVKHCVLIYIYRERVWSMLSLLQNGPDYSGFSSRSTRWKQASVTEWNPRCCEHLDSPDGRVTGWSAVFDSALSDFEDDLYLIVEWHLTGTLVLKVLVCLSRSCSDTKWSILPCVCIQHLGLNQFCHNVKTWSGQRKRSQTLGAASTLR